MKSTLSIGLLVLLGSSSTLSHSADPVDIRAGWVREMPPGTQSTAAYMVLHNNTDTSRTLIGVATEAAGRVEVHTTLHENGTMKMQRIDELEVPARGEAALAAGGDHVMLMGVSNRLTVGQSVMLELRFANGDTQHVELPVERGTPLQDSDHTSKHDNH